MTEGNSLKRDGAIEFTPGSTREHVRKDSKLRPQGAAIAPYCISLYCILWPLRSNATRQPPDRPMSSNLEKRADSCKGRLGYYRSSYFSVCLLLRMRKLYRFQLPQRHSTVHIGLSLRRKSIKLTRRGEGRWAVVQTGYRDRSPSHRVRRGIPAPQAVSSTERSGRKAILRCDWPSLTSPRCTSAAG